MVAISILPLTRLQDGKFKARDIHLRFELGNCNDVDVNLPKK